MRSFEVAIEKLFISSRWLKRKLITLCFSCHYIRLLRKFNTLWLMSRSQSRRQMFFCRLKIGASINLHESGNAPNSGGLWTPVPPELGVRGRDRRVIYVENFIHAGGLINRKGFREPATRLNILTKTSEVCVSPNEWVLSCVRIDGSWQWMGQECVFLHNFVLN